jgi:hypothetical protein
MNWEDPEARSPARDPRDPTQNQPGTGPGPHPARKPVLRSPTAGVGLNTLPPTEI